MRIYLPDFKSYLEIDAKSSKLSCLDLLNKLHYNQSIFQVLTPFLTQATSLNQPNCSYLVILSFNQYQQLSMQVTQQQSKNQNKQRSSQQKIPVDLFKQLGLKSRQCWPLNRLYQTIETIYQQQTANNQSSNNNSGQQNNQINQAQIIAQIASQFNLTQQIVRLIIHDQAKFNTIKSRKNLAFGFLRPKYRQFKYTNLPYIPIEVIKRDEPVENQLEQLRQNGVQNLTVTKLNQIIKETFPAKKKKKNNQQRKILHQLFKEQIRDVTQFQKIKNYHLVYCDCRRYEIDIETGRLSRIQDLTNTLKGQLVWVALNEYLGLVAFQITDSARQFLTKVESTMLNNYYLVMPLNQYTWDKSLHNASSKRLETLQLPSDQATGDYNIEFNKSIGFWELMEKEYARQCCLGDNSDDVYRLGKLKSIASVATGINQVQIQSLACESINKPSDDQMND